MSDPHKREQYDSGMDINDIGNGKSFLFEYEVLTNFLGGGFGHGMDPFSQMFGGGGIGKLFEILAGILSLG